MNKYKIQVGSWSIEIDSEELAEVESFAATLNKTKGLVLGKDYFITLIAENVQPTKIDVKVNIEKNILFGQLLIIEFRADNAAHEAQTGNEISVADTIALMTKFQGLIGLCQVGAIKEAAAILPSIGLDSIFTQSRKDKYIKMLNDFLKS